MPKRVLHRYAHTATRRHRTALRACNEPTRTRSLVALALCVLCGAGSIRIAMAQVQFPVSFEASAAGLTTTERAQVTSHVSAAGQLWVRELDIGSARSLEVVIGVDDSRPTAGGASATTAFVAVVGGRDLFEQGAAAELRNGTDPNGVGADVRITVNSAYLRNELWFDPNPAARTATVPVDRTDAMSVFLHEIGHAFAYNGFADLANGQPPATFWSTFDRWMVPGPPLPVRFSGPRAAAAHGSNPDLTSNNLFHWGNFARVATPPGRAWHAPVRFVDGRPEPRAIHDEPASVDAAALSATMLQPDALVDELMNGLFFVRGSRYAISRLDRATLVDAGLPVVLYRDGFE